MPQRKDPKTGKRQRKSNQTAAERGKGWANRFPTAKNSIIRSQRRKNQKTHKLSARNNLRARRTHDIEMTRQGMMERRRLRGYPKR